MTRLHTFFMLVCLVLPLSCWADSQLELHFDSAADAEQFAVRVSGEAERRHSPPAIDDGRLYLLPSWWKSSAAVGFAAVAPEPYRRITVAWSLAMNTGTAGAGFAWAPCSGREDEPMPPECKSWDAPNLPQAFAVGFDAANPPNRDPFRGSGNVYDRAQHEVSLHWDGREIVKRTTPMDFRDEQPHPVSVHIRFVTGGAEIDVTIDQTSIFESYFIPGMLPYPGHALFGARNGVTAGDVYLDDLKISCSQPTTAAAPPRTVVAMDHQLNDVATSEI